jgi:hypothetical protein
MKAGNQRFLHLQVFSNLETAALSRQKRVLSRILLANFGCQAGSRTAIIVTSSGTKKADKAALKC